jgi:drug/metabolite transporter (DMT)-like permease
MHSAQPSATKILGLLLIAVVSQATGNVLLSKAMKTASVDAGGSDWLTLTGHAVMSPLIWLGVACLLLFFVLFATVLSEADLSYVLPAISSEVVLNVAFADYFLNEAVSPARWMGAVLISIGVILVLRSAPRTFAAADAQPTVAGVDRR